MRRSFYFIELVIFYTLLVGCSKDIPDPVSELPDIYPKIDNINIEDNMEIPPNSVIIVKFNKEMATANINIPGISGNTALKGDKAFFTPYSDIPPGNYLLDISAADEFNRQIQGFSPIKFRVSKDASTIEPTKSKILFSSNRDGDYNIYTMNLDGTGITKLTYYLSDEFQPAWSPDGSKIAFVSDFDGLGAGDFDIFVMRNDGTGITNLTDSPGVSEYAPFWSKDNKRIGFYVLDDTQPYVINANGTNPEVLYSTDLKNFMFGWQSPDGGKEAIADNFTGNWEIYLSTVGGKTGINLTNNFADDFYPTFTSDSKRIVFMSNRFDFNNEIYIMNIDGTNVIRLTNNPADDRDPICSPF